MPKGVLVPTGAPLPCAPPCGGKSSSVTNTNQIALIATSSDTANGEILHKDAETLSAVNAAFCQCSVLSATAGACRASHSSRVSLAGALIPWYWIGPPSLPVTCSGMILPRRTPMASRRCNCRTSSASARTAPPGCCAPSCAAPWSTPCASHSAAWSRRTKR